MEAQSILNKLNQLPPEAQNKVLDFINLLEKKYLPLNAKKSLIDWNQLIGMWQNREDMIDSVSWVREVRQAGWRKP